MELSSVAVRRVRIHDCRLNSYQELGAETSLRNFRWPSAPAAVHVNTYSKQHLIPASKSLRSRDRVVGIRTRKWDERAGVRTPAVERHFSLLQTGTRTHPSSSLGSTTSIIKCFGLLNDSFPFMSVLNAELRILMIFNSFFTLFSHLFLGLPNDLVAMDFHSCTFFTILSSGILYTCPNQPNLVIWCSLL